MATIDDFFAHAHDPTVALNHPTLVEVKRGLDRGQKFEVEVFRPEELVGLIKTKIFVRLLDTEANGILNEHDWSDDLNSGLIQMGVRAVDHANESLRFAFRLRDTLSVVEKQVGNGYFNTVLLDLIVESKLDQYPVIENVLKFTYHDRVEHSERYYKCRDAIALQISGRARELTNNLDYSEEVAKKILPNAIAEYIDHRFSVSSRRQMGLL